MPLINYVVLAELVDELDALDALDASARPSAPDAAGRRRREDAEYTLCICTGVRDPRQAMRRARALLAGRERELAAGPVAAA